MSKYRRVEVHSVQAGRNAMLAWHRYVPVWKVVRNYLVAEFCRVCPSLRLKNFLYRCIGMSVGTDAFGLKAMVDIFPERIRIGDNTLTGYNSVLLAHEFYGFVAHGRRRDRPTPRSAPTSRFRGHYRRRRRHCQVPSYTAMPPGAWVVSPYVRL